MDEIRVRMCVTGDVMGVRRVCKEVQEEMGRKVVIVQLTRLIKHPSVAALTISISTLLYAIGVGLWWSTLVGVGITAAAGLIVFRTFWKRIRFVFQEGPDIVHLTDHYINHPQRAFLVATCGEKVVGMMGLCDTMEPQVTELVRIFVSHPFRRRGVASRLITAAHEEAARLGYSSVQLHTHTTNTGAMKYYERAGYVPQGNAVFLSMYPLSFDTIHYSYQLPVSLST